MRRKLVFDDCDLSDEGVRFLQGFCGDDPFCMAASKEDILYRLRQERGDATLAEIPKETWEMLGFLPDVRKEIEALWDANAFNEIEVQL